jgi:sugar transferase (PEP-CTERM/EpsH1 system associated)
MKILFLCHRFPYPPQGGAKIRPFNMIKHLAERHEVTVCSLVRDEQEVQEGRGLAEHCKAYVTARVREPWQNLRMVTRLPSLTPASMGYFYSAQLAREIRRCLNREAFDLIFVHCSSVAPYVVQVRGIPKILDFCDMDSQKWLQYARSKTLPLSLGYWIEGRKLMRVEKRLAKNFDVCTVATRAELETLNGYATGSVSDWFPNGVDHNYFSPDGAPYDADCLSFVGRMDYYPNQECMFEFCARTLPLIRSQRPNVKLLIVGADPSPAVLKLAERPGVTVTGSVPDVRPYVRRSALTIAPLNIARGTQNKILEAMAMGVPVVASELAARGVDALPGQHVLTASTPQGYATAVLRVLEHPEERARLAEEGRARILSHHQWSHSMQRLDAIIERAGALHSETSEKLRMASS